MESLHPLMQRDMAALHGRVHGHREIAPACLFGAAVGAGGLDRIGMVHDAAMGTDWAGWPAKAFQVGPGRYVVPKAWMRKCVHDHQSPVDGWILPLAACDVNDIIRTMILMSRKLGIFTVQLMIE